MGWKGEREVNKRGDKPSMRNTNDMIHVAQRKL